MSDVKQCDRCKILVKEDYTIPAIIRKITIKLMNKSKPFFWDFCQNCTEEFKKFLDFKEKKTR